MHHGSSAATGRYRKDRRLERHCCDSLRHLGDISRRGAGFGLPLRRRDSTGARLSPDARQDLYCECASSGELQLGLPKRELKVRMGRQRRGRDAARFLDRLPGYFIQGATRDAHLMGKLRGKA